MEPILPENVGLSIFLCDLQRGSGSVKIRISCITQNPLPAMACGFESHHRHQKGSAKKIHTRKTQEFPGFFGTQGGQKVQGFSVDAKPRFLRSGGNRTPTPPILVEIRGWISRRICSPRSAFRSRSPHRFPRLFERNITTGEVLAQFDPKPLLIPEVNSRVRPASRSRSL